MRKRSESGWSIGLAALAAAVTILGVGRVSGAEVPNMLFDDSVNPSVYGQSVTISMTLWGTSGRPTGTVQFATNGTDLDSFLTLENGGANEAFVDFDATPYLKVMGTGTMFITGRYSGDANYQSVIGHVVGGQTVFRASTMTAVGSSSNPSLLGQNVTFTATPSAVSPGSGTPDGAVQFTIDGSAYGSAVTVTNGVASVTDTFGSAATHTVSAQFQGNRNFNNSSGSLSGDQTVRNIGISPQSVRWTTIDTGGGVSAGGLFGLRGTIGQFDAGSLSRPPLGLNGGFWGGLTPPIPGLTILLTATNSVLITWPSPSDGFKLQQNTNGLVTGVWANVAGAPNDDGVTKSVVVKPPSGTRFYRLLRP